MKFYIKYLTSLFVFLCSCAGNEAEKNDIVQSLIGQSIILPSNIEVQLNGKSINFNNESSDFSIICYVASKGCVPCQMKLLEWKNLIDEFKGAEDVDVNFLMILEKNSDSIASAIKTTSFDHPVALDKEGAFMQINRLPTQSKYHTLLLDDNNDIIAVGNPVINPKVKNIYRNVIFGSEYGVTQDICPINVHNVGLLNKDDSVKTVFHIENKGKEMLTIQDVVPSCSCISAIIEKNEIAPNEVIDVMVCYHSGLVSGAFRQYIDLFYNEKSMPVRLTIYGHVQSNNV